ncbi:MAG: amidohydrolase family protein [Pyrinomonadaceae bacterium]
MNKHSPRTVFAFFVFLLTSVVVVAQPGTYAIKDARIVTVSGVEIPNGTVVVRGGLIESVGANAKIPADATIIEGKGLVVYPGFIDTYSSYGLPLASQSGNRSRGTGAVSESSNSNYTDGLRPDDYAGDTLKAGDAQFENQRNNGFTTALTVKDDGIFNGYSAVINLAGDSVSRMIISPYFAEHVSYRTERGFNFPTSLMGTFAAIRQMFYDAKRLDEIKAQYAKDPKGIKRPEADPALEALIPIVRGEKPIVFNANSEREIIRTLDLAKEFGLKAVIAGGEEAGNVAERLKAANVPVLLGLDFPTRTEPESADAEPEPMRLLRLRAEVPKVAGKLKAAGVRFAFQTGGAKDLKKVFDNAESTTKFGITKADVVRAFTLDAATLLGVDSVLGSVEQGKIANLVVMNGELFAKNNSIHYVFVDGTMFELPTKQNKPEKTEGKEISAQNLSGEWNITVSAPEQNIEIILKLEQSGNLLSGTMNSALFGSIPIKNGKATAEGFTFDADVPFGGVTMNVTCIGKVSGDKVEGSAGTNQGSIPFSGKRLPTKKGGRVK